MKMLVELNAMARTGFFPKIRPIPFLVHTMYSGLNPATARAIVYAGVPGFNAAGQRIN